jgi:hypothetical protein
MASIRLPSIAVALAIGIAAPATAGWWPIGTAASTTTSATTPPATTSATAAPRRPATTSTAVPEPADFILFAAGVVGLLLGRRGSRSRHD